MHPAEFAAEFGISMWLGSATMLTQVIGGILLILGALTPLAALGIAGTITTVDQIISELAIDWTSPSTNNAFLPTLSWAERLRAVAWERLSSRHSSESDEGNEL
jgi:uncharacterized membrane protein YphA (DoxX/SURF4 family)